MRKWGRRCCPEEDSYTADKNVGLEWNQKKSAKKSGFCWWSHKRRWSTLRTRHIFPVALQPGRGRSGIFSWLCGLLLKPRLGLESTGWRFWPGGIFQANMETAKEPVDRRRFAGDSPGPSPLCRDCSRHISTSSAALDWNAKQLKVGAA